MYLLPFLKDAIDLLQGHFISSAGLSMTPTARDAGVESIAVSCNQPILVFLLRSILVLLLYWFSSISAVVSTGFFGDYEWDLLCNSFTKTRLESTSANLLTHPSFSTYARLICSPTRPVDHMFFDYVGDHELCCGHVCEGQWSDVLRPSSSKPTKALSSCTTLLAVVETFSKFSISSIL